MGGVITCEYLSFFRRVLTPRVRHPMAEHHPFELELRKSAKLMIPISVHVNANRTHPFRDEIIIHKLPCTKVLLDPSVRFYYDGSSIL